MEGQAKWSNGGTGRCGEGASCGMRDGEEWPPFQSYTAQLLSESLPCGQLSKGDGSSNTPHVIRH